jgi:hypothetical protein
MIRKKKLVNIAKPRDLPPHVYRLPNNIFYKGIQRDASGKGG